MQTLAPTTVLPWQVPAPQDVLSGYLRQPPMPSHRPSRPQVEGSCSGHWLSSAGGMPAGTGAHMPALPGTSHFWQVPLQALLQQTPSTQKPLPHSSPQRAALAVALLVDHRLAAGHRRHLAEAGVEGTVLGAAVDTNALVRRPAADRPQPHHNSEHERGNVGRISDMVLLQSRPENRVRQNQDAGLRSPGASDDAHDTSGPRVGHKHAIHHRCAAVSPSLRAWPVGMPALGSAISATLL